MSLWPWGRLILLAEILASISPLPYCQPCIAGKRRHRKVVHFNYLLLICHLKSKRRPPRQPTPAVCRKRLRWKLWEIDVRQSAQGTSTDPGDVELELLENLAATYLRVFLFLFFFFFILRGCLVPRPYYSARPKSFGSRGPSQNARQAHSVFSRRFPPVHL